MKVNTNISSLIVQSNLKSSTRGLNSAIERMTTGFRINHAKDNAAGFSISTKLESRLSSYGVAQDNVSMGLDMLTTATDSLDLIYSHLTRIRDLAEQSANDTYGEDSKNAINSEVNALINEINRIYGGTEYNGISLLDASKGAGASIDSFVKPADNKFIKEVKHRDTDGMTRLSDVDSNKHLGKGVYSISTAEEMVKLSEMVNSGKISSGSEFVLADDIDLSGIDWVPIGLNNAFSSGFDGNGYTISNLKCGEEGDESYRGLFGVINDGVIKNLGIENAEVSGELHVGLLAGAVYNSKIENCYASGRVIGVKDVGGLIGGAYAQDPNILSDITYCHTDAAVKIISEKVPSERVENG